MHIIIGAGIAESFGCGLRDGEVGVRVGVFSTSSRPVLGPTQHPIQWVPGASFSGGKAAGVWS
jgi:hypothetical protein